MTEPIYGVWIPGTGWLRANGAVFADNHRKVAEQVARLIGNKATVRYVDESITKLESAYLEHEKESLWRILTSFKIFRK